MPIKITCRNCGKAMHVADKHAGRKVRCPGCQGVLSIPALPPVEAAPVETFDFSDTEEDEEFGSATLPSRIRRGAGKKSSTSAKAKSIGASRMDSSANGFDRKILLLAWGGIGLAIAVAVAVWAVKFRGLTQAPPGGLPGIANSAIAETVGSGGGEKKDLTNLESLAARAAELDQEMRSALKGHEIQTTGNELKDREAQRAAREQRDSALAKIRSKLDDEIGGLKGKTVQGIYAVDSVSRSSNHDFVRLKGTEPCMGVVLTKERSSDDLSITPRLRVGEYVSSSFAKELLPEDRLLIKGTVEKVAFSYELKQGFLGPTYFIDRPIMIYLSDVKVERSTEPGPAARPKTVTKAPDARKTKPGEPTPEDAAAACGTAGAGCASCGIFAILVPIAFLVLHIVLMIWVARDAKARGVDSSAVWVILVILFGLLGFVIYIFSRPKGELVECRHCQNKRLRVRRLCPHCGNA